MYYEKKEKNDTPTTISTLSPMERFRRIVDFLVRNYSTAIPKTIEKLQREVLNAGDEPSAQLREWINIIENLLDDHGRLDMTRQKATMIELIIGRA